ncbi:type I-E CRISPR-associated protein Cas7/Cse4/CasC [Streptomyces chrestomyceticus]|uniref:type I-E CRISPR-associated protein Cas7/Cse4/CasC n=1 Tax=Streptomyces chrestomyceticus TaxID=68185 RepID=UPI0036B8DC35
MSYAAAFEKPVTPSNHGGFAEISRTRLTEYAQAANTLMGTAPLISSGWASLETKDLTGLGRRHGSFQDLITEDATHPSGEVNDQPLSFHPRHRAYRARPLYRRTLHLPAHQFAGLGTAQLTALDAYLREHLNQPEGSPQ